MPKESGYMYSRTHLVLVMPNSVYLEAARKKRCPRSPHPPVLSSKTALINILESLLHDWELLKDRSSSDPSVFMNSLSLTMLRIPAMSLLQVPC